MGGVKLLFVRYVRWNVVYIMWYALSGTIDFSINGICTENRLRSQRTPTPYTINVNNSRLIDFVIRTELTRAILMSRFSNCLRNSIIHFRVFLYFETCFPRVTVSLLRRLQAVSKIHVPIHAYI